QSYGSLSRNIDPPPAHQRRSLGGSRRDAVRATAHGTGAGKPELQSAGQRFQTDSDHRSQLNESQRSTRSDSRNKRLAVVCSTRVREAAFIPPNPGKSKTPWADSLVGARKFLESSLVP